MSIIKSFLNKFRGYEKKGLSEIPVQTGTFLDFALRGENTLTPFQALEFYRNNAAIATSVDLIAQSIEQISPILLDKDGNQMIDSPVIELLDMINGFDSWSDFIGSVARNYLLTGNAYIVAFGNIKKPPLEIYSLKPQNVYAIQDPSDSYANNYHVSIGVGADNYVRNSETMGLTRFFANDLRELYHIMTFSSDRLNIKGDSPLQAAALEAKQQIQSKVHNLQILNKGGRLSLIVTVNNNGVTTQEQHDYLKRKINEDLAGANNSGGIAVISGSEVSIKEAGQTMKDMDFTKLQELTNNAIYLRYKIPLPLVTTTASTFNNVEKSILSLYDQAVIPITNILFSNLSRLLLPRFNIDPRQVKITFNPDSITALMDRRLDQMKKRADMQVETKNELRSLLPGREDIEGGDILYQAANQVPLGFDVSGQDVNQ